MRSTADPSGYGHIMKADSDGVVVPLRKRAPHASKDLQTVLGKAMETDPRRRYATAAEFADDLERLVALHDASTIAAVIVEPLIQGAGGMRMYHPIYLTLLREARHAVPIPPPGFSWTFAVSEFVLYESRFSRGRTRYTALERYPFNKES